MSIEDLRFPLYFASSKRKNCLRVEGDNVIYQPEEHSKKSIIARLSVPGTLAEKRLKDPEPLASMKKFKLVRTLSQLLVFSDGRPFIDSNCRIYRYKRTKYYKVRCYKVTEIQKIRNTNKYAVTFEDFVQRFIWDYCTKEEYGHLVRVLGGIVLLRVTDEYYPEYRIKL